MTTNATINAAGPLPDPIIRTLRRMVRRARLVILLRGVFAVAAVAAGAVLTVMAVDYAVTIRADWPRWVLSILAVGAVALTLLWFLVRPLARSLTLAGIARAIETRHPELHERISSAIELLSSPDAPALRGSDALIAALAAEATRDARGVQIKREVTLRSVRPFIIAAASVAVVFAGLFVAQPEAAGRLLRRAVAPHRDYANAHAWQLTVSPGDATVAAGDRLTIEVVVANEHVASIQLLRSDPGGDETAIEMVPLPGADPMRRRFAHTTGRLDSSFAYRIEGGRALSRRYSVTVVPIPSVEKLDVFYEYPAYTMRRPLLQRDASGDIRAVVGSTVVLTAETNTAVTAAEMIVNDKPFAQAQPVGGEDQGGPKTWVFRFPLTSGLNGEYQIRLTKRVRGETFSSMSEPRQIEAAPDAAPLAKITNPAATTLRLRPDDRLPVFYAASDRFGLSAVRLLVTLGRQEQPPAALPIDANNAAPALAAAGKTVIDLKSMDLLGVRQITFQVQAADNLPENLDGPQVGYSRLCTIQLDVDAESYDRQFILAEELFLRDVLEKVLVDLKAAQTHSAPLQRTLEKLADPKSPVDGPLSQAHLKRIDAIHKHLLAAEKSLRDAILQIGGGTYAGVADKLTALTDNHVTKADSAAAQIRIADSPQRRADLADEADFQIERAVDIVAQMLKELDRLSEMIRDAQDLKGLAEMQRQLADALRGMEGLQESDSASQPASRSASQPGAGISEDQPPPMSQQEWEKGQAGVAAELGQMVRRSPQALGSLLDNERQRSKSLIQRARELAKQQSDLADVTGRITLIDKIDRDLAALVKQQELLAKRAAARPATSKTGEAMAAATDEIKRGNADEALRKQTRAEKDLLRLAQGQARRRATSQLARYAESLAKRQRALARQVARERRLNKVALAAAATAARRAQRAGAAATRAKGALAARAPQLATGQNRLAQRSRQIEQAVAANPVLSASRKFKPSTPMTQAAAKTEPATLDQAAKVATAAAQQTARLAASIDVERKRAENTAAIDTAILAAEANVRAARNAAAAADRAAVKTAAAARAADADKPAAQTIAKQKNAAAEKAKTALQAAQKKAGDLKRTKAKRLQDAQAARKLAEQARQLRADQDQLRKAIAEAHKDLALMIPAAGAAATAAEKDRQRHIALANAAIARVKPAIQSQANLAKQADALVEKASQATASARQAVANHNPAAVMGQAAQALKKPNIASAETLTAQAATKARQLAKTLRDADAALSPVARAAAMQAEAVEQFAQAAARAAEAAKAGATARSARNNAQHAAHVKLQAIAASQLAAAAQEAAAAAAGKASEAAKLATAAAAKQASDAAAKSVEAQKAHETARAAEVAAARQRATQIADPIARHRASRIVDKQVEAHRAATAAHQYAIRAAQAVRQAAAKSAQAANAAKTAHNATQKAAAKQLARAAKRQAAQAARQAKQVAAKARRARQADAAAHRVPEQTAKAAAAERRAADAAKRSDDAGLAAAAAAAQASQAADRAVAAAAKAQPNIAHPSRTASQQAAQAVRQAQQAAVKAQKAQKAADAQQTPQAARAARAAAGKAAAAQQRAVSLMRNAYAQAERAVAAENLARAAKQQQADQLAKAQRQIRKRAADLLAARAKMAGAIETELLAKLTRRQRALSEQVAEMTDSVKELAPQTDRIDTKGARAAMAATRALRAGGKISEAARAAEDSANRLAQLSLRLGADPARPDTWPVRRRMPTTMPALQAASQPGAGDPNGAVGAPDTGKLIEGSKDHNPEQIARDFFDEDAFRRDQLTREAAELAQRQLALAQALGALAAGRPQGIVRPRQLQIARGTYELADDVELVRRMAENVFPEEKIQQAVNAAAEHLHQATGSQKLADTSAARGRFAQTGRQQRKAASHIAAAAAALEQMTREMAALADKNPSPPPEPEEMLDPLAAALDAAQDAQQFQLPSDAERAAAMLEQLAQAAAAQAQMMGLQPFPGMAGNMPGAQLGRRPGQGTGDMGLGNILLDLTPAQLERLGITRTDWGMLPGELRDPIIQAVADQGPKEYREMIKRYFQEVAERGGDRAPKDKKK